MNILFGAKKLLPPDTISGLKTYTNDFSAGALSRSRIPLVHTAPQTPSWVWGRRFAAGRG